MQHESVGESGGSEPRFSVRIAHPRAQRVSVYASGAARGGARGGDVRDAGDA